jgi:hypothetical protein
MILNAGRRLGWTLRVVRVHLVCRLGSRSICWSRIELRRQELTVCG